MVKMRSMLAQNATNRGAIYATVSQDKAMTATSLRQTSPSVSTAELQALFADIGEVVTSVSLSLAAAGDDQLDAVIDSALGAIARHEGADRAYINLYDGDGTFSASHEWVAPGVLAQRDSIVGFALASFPWSVQKAVNGDIWHCPDLADLPPEAEAERRTFAAFGVKSVLQVPMRDGSRTIGVVGFNHLQAARDWPPLTIELVRRVADAIGFALLRREITRDLRAARDEAQRASLAKDRFLSRLSHELHTPLHAILGFAELMDSADRSPTDRAALRQIRTSGEQLRGLVAELLALTEREAGGA